MEFIGNVLMIIGGLATIGIFFFALNILKIKEKNNRKIDINNIKFYLEEYLKEFNTSKILELDIKVKMDNNTQTPMHPFLTILIAIITTVPICVLRLIGPKFVKSLDDIILIAGLGIIFFAFTFIILFLTQRATTKKII